MPIPFDGYTALVCAVSAWVLYSEVSRRDKVRKDDKVMEDFQKDVNKIKRRMQMGHDVGEEDLMKPWENYTDRLIKKSRVSEMDPDWHELMRLYKDKVIDKGSKPKDTK